MESLIRILFIINPISGVGKKNTIPPLIESILPKNKFDWKIEYTQHRKHGYEIAKDQKKNYEVIVAVGGDGSVNEIGSALVHSSCALGIIPCGSGNGLARHLGIPLNTKKAIERIAQFSAKKIDTGLLNKHAFLGTCGFGFDAHIANKFNQLEKRGFMSYVKLVTLQYNKYKSSNFTIEHKNQTIKQHAFLCSVANSSQFGNGFTIAPQSNINDGIFELVLMERFPLIEIPLIIRKFFGKSIHTSKYYQTHAFDEPFTITVKSEHPPYYHIDGEALQGERKFHVEILPQSLFVL